MKSKAFYYFGEKAARDFAALLKKKYDKDFPVFQVQGEINTWEVRMPEKIHWRLLGEIFSHKESFDAGLLSGSNFPTTVIN